MAIKKKSVDVDDPYKTNIEKTKAKLKEAGGDDRWWKPKPNTKNIVRILPPWGKGADGSFYFSAGLHYNFQIGGTNRAIACNRTKNPPERCLVCELAEALKNSGNEDLEKVVTGSKGIKIKRKYWVNLIDRKYPEEVKMYGGNKNFIKTLQEALDDPDFGDITDVNEGYDVRVNRVGSGFTDTRYTFSIRPKPSALGLDNWKELVHQLDKEVVDWFGLPEQAKLIRANYADEMAEVGFKINLPKDALKKKKAKDEDEEEEVDEDDEEVAEEEDEDEDEEKPAKKKVKKKPVKDEDDDEDDDLEETGDDDDEED
jgi:hypothetical protein